MDIKESVEVCWGKSADEGDFWLPVWVHLLDTYSVSQLLYEQWIPQAVKNLLMQDLNLKDNELKQFLGWLAGIHDLGKLTPGFYHRDSILNEYSPNNTVKLYNRMKKYNIPFKFKDATGAEGSLSAAPRHEASTALLLEKRLKSIIMPSFTPKNYRAIRSLSVILAGHHGSPSTDQFNKSDNAIQEGSRYNNYKTWEEIQNIVYNFIIEHIFCNNEAFVELIQKILYPNNTANVIPERSQIILTSLIIMSDWVASNNENYPLLEYNNIPSIDDKIFIQQRMNLHTNIYDFRLNSAFKPQKLNINTDFEQYFVHRFSFSPNILQSTMINLIKQKYEKGQPLETLYIIEAPMGTGKTEAAFITAELINGLTGRSGLFFGLPTMATANAISNRVHAYITSYGKDNNGFTETLIHSKANFTKQKQRIQQESYDNDYGLVPQGWLSSKYTDLLNNFVVSTIDTFLALTLKRKYLYWKYLGFSTKTIILDEIHATDPYMLGFLLSSLQWAGYFRIPVIITTATLESSLREQLIGAYKIGGRLAQ